MLLGLPIAATKLDDVFVAVRFCFFDSVALHAYARALAPLPISRPLERLPCVALGPVLGPALYLP